MISKDIMIRFLKGNQLMILCFKPDPLDTHRESLTQIKSEPSNKRVEKINRSAVSHIREGGERA